MHKRFEQNFHARAETILMQVPESKFFQKIRLSKAVFFRLHPDRNSQDCGDRKILVSEAGQTITTGSLTIFRQSGFEC